MPRYPTLWRSCQIWELDIFWWFLWIFSQCSFEHFFILLKGLSFFLWEIGSGQPFSVQLQCMFQAALVAGEVVNMLLFEHAIEASIEC
jgi:hypothetical protein